MTDSADLSNNPGRILRAAREELAYSTSYVADALHLRVSVVEAIENEDYDEFSSDVFLKGYFRSYCRLVKLHESRMVELLENQLKERKKGLAEHESELKRIASQQKRKKLIIVSTVFVAVLVVVALLTHFIASNEERVVDEQAVAGDIAQVLSTSEGGNEPADSGSDIQESVTVEASSETLVVDESEIDDEAVQESQEPELVETNEVVQEAAVEDESFIDADESESEQTATEMLVNEAPEQTVFETARLSIDFSGDCWLELKNGEGRTVIADLKRAGDRVSYEGASPFSVLLGDATVAALTFNENSIDLGPYTSTNGRAKFTLEAEE